MSKAALSKGLTIAQVAAAFGVSQMAIFYWRKGTTTRDPLPEIPDNDSRFPRFAVADLKKHAKKYGLELKHDPVDVVANWELYQPPKKQAKSAPTKSKSSASAKKKPRH